MTAHESRRLTWWRSCVALAGPAEVVALQRLLVERAAELGILEELSRARLEAAGKEPR